MTVSHTADLPVPQKGLGQIEVLCSPPQEQSLLTVQDQLESVHVCVTVPASECLCGQAVTLA